MTNCFLWVRALRLGGQGLAGSVELQPGHHNNTKNSALATDFDTTSGIVIPLETLRQPSISPQCDATKLAW